MAAIDIVIPVFNKEKFVVRALTSLQLQSFEDWHATVVNDGSTDGSAAAIRTVEDSRISVIDHENRGVSTARNGAIEQGSSPLVAFLDGDDFWLPNHLADLKALADLAPDAALLGTGYIMQTAADRYLLPRFAPPAKEGFCGLVDDYFAFATAATLPLLPSNSCVRRDALAEVGSFDAKQRLGEDQDVWARLALRFPVAYDSGVSVIYEARPQGRASANFPLHEELPFSRRLQSALDQGEVPERLRQSVQTYLRWHLMNIARDCAVRRDWTSLWPVLGDRRIWAFPQIVILLVRYLWRRQKARPCSPSSTVERTGLDH